MKTKTKKRIYRITKIVWFILGGFIFLWTAFFFVKMHTFSGSGMAGIGGAIGLAALFVVGICMFSIFIGITLLFLLIKWIVKRWRKN